MEWDAGARCYECLRFKSSDKGLIEGLSRASKLAIGVIGSFV